MARQEYLVGQAGHRQNENTFCLPTNTENEIVLSHFLDWNLLEAKVGQAGEPAKN